MFEHESKGEFSNISNEFGVSPEALLKAKKWADKWYPYIEDMSVDELTLNAFSASRDISLYDAPSVTRDENGKPSFREEFTATELVLDRLGDRAKHLRQDIYGDEIKPVPHFDRLDSILDILLKQRAKKGFPYELDSAQLPQDERNMPPSLPRGGKEHANFLFTTCYYMRGGIKSYVAFKALSSLYEKDPNLFDPQSAQMRNPEDIATALAEEGLGFSKDVISKQWVFNAAKLQEENDGDARKLFENTTDYRKLLHRIQNKNGNGFKGFQEKMTSMLAYFFMTDGIIPYFDFPLPVDFHVLRVSAANKIITFENMPENGNIYHQSTLDMLRNMYHDYSVSHGISQLDVCDAVWALSSGICGDQPGNIMLEPHRKDGRKGRGTIIEPLEINIHDPDQQRRYERTCSLCVLDETCELNFPSKAYYVQGRMTGSPRIRFPQNTLFGIETLFPQKES